MIYDNQKGKTNVLRDFASLLEYQMNEAFYVSISESIYLYLELHKSIPNSVNHILTQLLDLTFWMFQFMYHNEFYHSRQ